MSRSRTARAGLIGAACLTGLLFVSLGGAQAPSETAHARSLFERADALLIAGRFAEARDLLRESLAAFAHPSTAFNLAVALRGTGDAVGAAEVLRALGEGQYGELRPEQRGEAGELLAEIEPEIVVVTARVCGGEDVSVRFDGALWERFDGCRDLERRANPGRHVLTVNGAGRLPREEPIELVRGDPFELSLTLVQMPTGELVVRVPDEDVQVEVVGVGRGIGGFSRALPAGPYRIRAYLDPSAPEERTVTLEAGASLELSIGAGDDTALVVAIVVALALAAAAAGIVTAVVLTQEQRVRPLIEDDIFGVTETLGVRF